jgi:uncharacterized membrane protein YvbJ
MQNCPHCHSTIADGIEFCPRCGKHLTKHESSESHSSPRWSDRVLAQSDGTGSTQTDRLLQKLIDIENRNNAYLRNISSNTSVVAAIMLIQAIFVVLFVLGIIR